MRHTDCAARCCLFLLIFCLLAFAACSPANQAQDRAPYSSSPAPIGSKGAQKSATPHTNGNLPAAYNHVQTDCPANGQARAAVLKPLSLGSHPTLIYTSNEVSKDASTSSGVLKRYDSVSQHTSLLVASGRSINGAQISADGQWVLFLSQGNAGKGNAGPGAGTRVQLVRLDGTGLQTLYCAPSSVTISDVQWSDDQKSILVDTLDSATNTSTIRLLDVATGALSTELQAPLGPAAYRTITWLDGTHAYIGRGLGLGQDVPQPAIYVLSTRNNKDLHGGNLNKVSDIPASGGDMHLESGVDKSVDAKTLFLGYCISSGAGWVSRITVQPATGGAQHDLYQNIPGCIKDLRAVSRSQLLLITRVPDQGFSKEILLQANINGSGITTLYKNSGPHIGLQLNRHAPRPWSNVSRDGHLYAFNEQGAMVGVSKLIIGSFSTGKLTPLVSNPAGTVSVTGWTSI